ncbi:MAG: hypothetical protein WA254_00480 [Candidatus Sulfotelmatobacter sp.]
MKDLANGVSDLKRVLTNVKTRGGFGEMQLDFLPDACGRAAVFPRSRGVGPLQGNGSMRLPVKTPPVQW